MAKLMKEIFNGCDSYTNCLSLLVFYLNSKETHIYLYPYRHAARF
jgi:hypothetical protein